MTSNEIKEFCKCRYLDAHNDVCDYFHVCRLGSIAHFFAHDFGYLCLYFFVSKLFTFYFFKHFIGFIKTF